MKTFVLSALLVCLWAMPACTGEKEAVAKKISLESDNDRISYAIGMDIGRNLKQQQLDVNPKILAAGLQAMLSGGETLLTQEEMQQAIAMWQQEMQQKMAEQNKMLAEQNRQAGLEFLEENKAKEGVQVTDSGLQYEVVEKGEGPSPTLKDTVVAHYKGTLIDGTVFDSSYERGQPATFPLQGLIPGWQEALTMMHEGGKWKLYVPSDLAYGDRQAGEHIKPGSTLIFDIELLEVKNAEGADNAEEAATESAG